MAYTIDRTAIIDKNAKLDKNVTVAAYAVIEAGTKIGSGTTIGAHSVIKKGTTLGINNTLAEGVVIGGAPQDVTFSPADESFVTIGNHNTIREQVTIHRSAEKGNNTYIGDHNFLMCQCHVAHDVTLGSHVVLANNVLLAGHVSVGDHAFISGNVVIHQHVRIGRNVMLTGLIRVSRDAPPFSLVAGYRACFAGLNFIGMRRAQISSSDRILVKKFYREFYSSPRQSAFLASYSTTSPLITEIITFIKKSDRGVLTNRSTVLFEASKSNRDDDDELLL
ncbi:acyl-[acyl-carrier-protein]--UDP-N-acetylglucosamine O-acyltransferase [Spirochaetota bacterium]|nr:acyl-[acyl-carrier-protein]--UDP-N-acetylglucosamine O-acyltransferase [Spirochaetota bacterium]